MDRAVARWVRLAERDIRPARVLLGNDDPENALFLCQQAIEKALKAHVQVTTDDVPPKIHSLMRLAQLAGLWQALGEDHQKVLLAADPYAVAGRCGPPNRADDRSASRSDAIRLINGVEEVVQWLLARLK